MNRLTLTVLTAAATLYLCSCAQQPVIPADDTLSIRAELAAERPFTVPRNDSEPDLAASAGMPAEPSSALPAVDGTARAPSFDVRVTDRSAERFFAELGLSQSLNFLVDPSIQDRISLSLSAVNLEQVIHALQDLYGYDFQRTSYGYRVMPNQITTRLYHLNVLNVDRTGSSATQIAGDDRNAVITTVSSRSDSGETFWQGIQRSLGALISAGANEDSVIVNEQTGLIIVTATTAEHLAIHQFLQDAELIMQQQVIIEAKIVEVVLDEQHNSGINWQLFDHSLAGSQHSATIGLAGNALAGNGDSGGLFNLTLSLDNFTALLQLLDHQGDVQVLSSPRISTVNNQKAVIKVGTDDYYATVHSVSTGKDDKFIPSITLEPFFSGIALDVTPQIESDSNVMLHVRPTVTDVIERTRIIRIADQNYSLPLAQSNIRESDSIIRAQSGNIVVIGGLLQHRQDSSATGLVWLSQLPWFGKLFRQDRQRQQKSELVILLKPTIYGAQTSRQELDSVINRLN